MRYNLRLVGSTVNIGENTQNFATDALPPVVSSMSSEDIHTLPNLKILEIRVKQNEALQICSAP